MLQGFLWSVGIRLDSSTAARIASSTKAAEMTSHILSILRQILAEL